MLWHRILRENVVRVGRRKLLGSGGAGFLGIRDSLDRLVQLLSHLKQFSAKKITSFFNFLKSMSYKNTSVGGTPAFRRRKGGRAMQTAERAVFSTARENADIGLGSLSLVLKNATFSFSGRAGRSPGSPSRTRRGNQPPSARTSVFPKGTSRSRPLHACRVLGFRTLFLPSSRPPKRVIDSSNLRQILRDALSTSHILLVLCHPSKSPGRSFGKFCSPPPCREWR